MLMRIARMGIGTVAVCLYLYSGALASAQPSAVGTQQIDMQRVMDRLDRLEKQNQDLLAEIRELRRQLAPAQAADASPYAAVPLTEAGPPTTAERLDVQESRTEELAQSKVGTTQRMPVALTGMILFNAFRNGGFAAGVEAPAAAQLTQSPAATGASVAQTVIGLKFNGPDLPFGGKASGSAYFDFWGSGTGSSYNLFRIRTATVDLSWKNTTITAGQDKPIVSPREPTSLAEVGVPPLAGAGNLWYWQPQLRIEQRFVFGNSAGSAGADSSGTGLRIQAGAYETATVYPSSGSLTLPYATERQHPSYEGRLLFYRGSERKRLEVAPGFHFGDSRAAGQSIHSRLGTLDWLMKLSDAIEFSGAFFRGTDDAGLGGLQQGFSILPSGAVIPVHATGGWGQAALFPAGRFSFHLFGGAEGDRSADLLTNGVRRNVVYAGNIVYKLAPNVLTAIEASQTRTEYITSGLRLNNHYDLALAYLF